MKKIIIVNNNMEIGGVQKSLHSLLWAIHDRYDVTLCLFRAKGVYMQTLPPDVKVVECKGLFRYLGKSQGEWTGAHKLLRGVLALTAKRLGRHSAMKLLLAGEKELQGTYDYAISYLQNGKIKNFYGGVQEYVLHKIRAATKVAFLHCDYGKSGSNHPVNNRLLEDFDRIAACSEGCRRSVVKVLPQLAQKCVTVRNCHHIQEIRQLADEDTVVYDPAYRNVVMVSRLSHEKGIERAIEAVARCEEQGIPVRLHIVGDGSVRHMLEEKVAECGIGERVFFYGEHSNPYRFMKNADLFLMTSYHEAAPMVIDEARCLSVPILTTETTSSYEMVTQQKAGWVCDNSQQGLTDALLQVLSDPSGLLAVREGLGSRPMSNDEAVEQFARLIEG